MAESFVAFAVIVAVGGTGYVVRLVFKTVQYQRVQTSPLRMDDEGAAGTEFLRLLAAAKEQMVIFDNGDKVEDSIYDREEVVEHVQQKLREEPAFRMYCLFNRDEPDIRFRDTFQGGEPRVSIKIVKHREPCSESGRNAHYKMIDGGVQAYLSWHGPGRSKRLYKTVDCSGVAKSQMEHVTNKVLGAYKSHFSREFGPLGLAS